MDYIIDYEKLYFTKGNVEVLNYQITPVCMALFNQNEGACATVNLGTYCGNNTIMPKNCAFIDTNNNPGLDKYIKERGYGEPYTRFGGEVTAQSGFCTYPLFQFNESKLKELDPDGYETYESNYKEAFTKEQRKSQANFLSAFESPSEESLEKD